MRLALVHVGAQTRELVRHPAYSVPTLAFPAMFFLFFATPRADHGNAVFLLASFAGFAVVGIPFFQFGVGIAAERETPWEAFVRTLPVTARVRLAARALSAAEFAAGAVVLVAVVAVATTPARLPPARWVELAVALFVGTIPFALLGTAIGYLATPKAALPLANVLYLGLSYAGGLWTGRTPLPHGVEALSPYLPTRQLADVLWAAVAGDPWQWSHWLALTAFAVVFGALAAFAYRRDEGRRYR